MILNPSKHDRMLPQNKLSKVDLEIVKILFQDKLKTTF